MKPITHFLTLLALGALLASCGGTPDADGFVEVQDITATDSTTINEILDPDRFTLTKDYALIISPKSNKAIYRYSLPDWEFIDTTFAKGQGPKDMLNPIFMQANSTTEDKIWITDPSKGELRELQVTKDSVRVLKTIPVKESIWFASIVDDKYILDEKIDFENTKREHLYTFDLKDSLRIVDSTLNISLWEIIIRGENKISMGKITGTAYPHKDKMFYFYPDIGSVMLYSISPEGKFSYIKTMGKEYTYEQLVAMNASYESDEWIDILTVTDKYIYYSYQKFEEIPDPQDPSKTKRIQIHSEIRVYDHDMNPVKKFIFHNPRISKVLIDEDRGKFYAWDQEMDFEQVYTYKYKL